MIRLQSRRPQAQAQGYLICKIREQEVTAKLEVCSLKKPLAKVHALFHMGLNAGKGDESKITMFQGKLQNSFRGRCYKIQLATDSLVSIAN